MKEKEVLLKLHQNVEMGLVGIDSIQDKIKSHDLLEVILKQEKQYNSIKKALTPMCKKYHVDDKELGSMVQMESDMMVNMKMAFDKSDSHVAKMMVEGTNKGLVQLHELKNHYEGEDKKILPMIENLIEFEERSLDELKKYI